MTRESFSSDAFSGVDVPGLALQLSALQVQQKCHRIVVLDESFQNAYGSVDDKTKS